MAYLIIFVANVANVVNKKNRRNFRSLGVVCITQTPGIEATVPDFRFSPPTPSLIFPSNVNSTPPSCFPKSNHT